jgi:uncharacterized damage-inducible protein DinB
MPELDLVGSERDVLLYYLGRMREALVQASDGLTDEQQRAAGVPSGTNLLGLIQHMTDGEIHWFQTVFLGAGPEVSFSMEVPADRTRAEVVAAYEAAAQRTDEIVRATPDLSTLAKATNPGEPAPVALRRILTHTIRETARHCGHADILREQIDGHTAD